jgi:hypothetical protein
MFKVPSVFPVRSGKPTQTKSSYDTVRDAFAGVFSGDLQNETASLATNDYYGSLMQSEMFPYADSSYSSSNVQYGNEPPPPSAGSTDPPDAGPPSINPPVAGSADPPTEHTPGEIRVDGAEFYWFMSILARLTNMHPRDIFHSTEEFAWFDATFAFYYTLSDAMRGMLQTGKAARLLKELNNRAAYMMDVISNGKLQDINPSEIPIPDSVQTVWLVQRLAGTIPDIQAPTSDPSEVPSSYNDFMSNSIQRSYPVSVSPAFVTPRTSPGTASLSSTSPEPTAASSGSEAPSTTPATSTAPSVSVDTNSSRAQTSVDAANGKLKPTGLYGLQPGYGRFFGTAPNMSAEEHADEGLPMEMENYDNYNNNNTTGTFGYDVPMVPNHPIVAENLATDALFAASVNRNRGVEMRSNNTAFVPLHRPGAPFTSKTYSSDFAQIRPRPSPAAPITASSFANNNKSESKRAEAQITAKLKRAHDGDDDDDDEIVFIQKVPRVITPISVVSSRASSSTMSRPGSNVSGLTVSRPGSEFSSISDEPPPAWVGKKRDIIRKPPPSTLMKRVDARITPRQNMQQIQVPARRTPTPRVPSPTESETDQFLRAYMDAREPPGRAQSRMSIASAPIVPPSRVPSRMSTSSGRPDDDRAIAAINQGARANRVHTPLTDSHSYPRNNNIKQIGQWIDTRLGWYHDLRDVFRHRFSDIFNKKGSVYERGGPGVATMRAAAKALADIIAERGEKHGQATRFWGTGLGDGGIDKNAVRIILGEIEAGNNNPLLIHALERAMKA